MCDHFVYTFRLREEITKEKSELSTKKNYWQPPWKKSAINENGQPTQRRPLLVNKMREIQNPTGVHPFLCARYLTTTKL